MHAKRVLSLASGPIRRPQRPPTGHPQATSTPPLRPPPRATCTPPRDRPRGPPAHRPGDRPRGPIDVPFPWGPTPGLRPPSARSVAPISQVDAARQPGHLTASRRAIDGWTVTACRHAGPRHASPDCKVLTHRVPRSGGDPVSGKAHLQLAILRAVARPPGLGRAADSSPVGELGARSDDPRAPPPHSPSSRARMLGTSRARTRRAPRGADATAARDLENHADLSTRARGTNGHHRDAPPRRLAISLSTQYRTWDEWSSS